MFKEEKKDQWMEIGELGNRVEGDTEEAGWGQIMESLADQGREPGFHSKCDGS